MVVINSRKKRGKPSAANQSEDAVNPSSTSLFSEDKATPKSKARVQNRLTPRPAKRIGSCEGEGSCEGISFERNLVWNVSGGEGFGEGMACRGIEVD